MATLLAGAPGPAVLVLDDYHLVSDPAVHRATTLLIERLPPQVRVVIATRADPPLPLARLRARAELLEVRADALRFTLDEARRFFADRLDPALPEADIAVLVERTEGWPAVLQLAALSLAGGGDPSERVRTFAATHRFVLDYVVEEVLAGLPAETSRFLVRTSILERLNGPLCDEVTGEAGGQERLEAMERANLLIVPLDDDRRWYRYHALFAEVLRARLRMLHADEVPVLHARASVWHEAHGNDDEAVHHVLRSGDPGRTSRLVGDASLRRLNAGELGTVRRWLDGLPTELVREEAQLSASYAWCLTLAGETDGVAARIADAERALAEGHDGGPFSGPMLPTQLALLRSRLADLEGDSGTAISEARRARTLVPAGLPPGSEATLRGDASVLLARALLTAGDVDGAVDAYEEALPDLRAGGNVFAAGRAIGDLVMIAIERGDPADALRRCEREIELHGAGAVTDGAVSGTVHGAMARALEALGMDDRARLAARTAVDIGLRSGDGPCVRGAMATLERLDRRSQAGGASGRGHARPAEDGMTETLSARELEVLCLLATGCTNSEIAARLFVTVGTVKSHLHSISGKLGASNRVEAVARARERGLVQ